MSHTTAAVFGSLASDEAITLVVQLLERGEDGATVTQLQKATKLPQPTVSRALQTLCRAGVLDRDRVTKAYKLTSTDDVRGLIERASELALIALKARTMETESLQRRVRKTRLSSTQALNRLSDGPNP